MAMVESTLAIYCRKPIGGGRLDWNLWLALRHGSKRGLAGTFYSVRGGLRTDPNRWILVGAGTIASTKRLCTTHLPARVLRDFSTKENSCGSTHRIHAWTDPGFDLADRLHKTDFHASHNPASRSTGRDLRWSRVAYAAQSNFFGYNLSLCAVICYWVLQLPDRVLEARLAVSNSLYTRSCRRECGRIALSPCDVLVCPFL